MDLRMKSSVLQLKKVLENCSACDDGSILAK